jgi:histidinol-phosphate aminotransferase
MFESKYIKELKSYKLSSHRAWELAVTNDVLKLDWNEATVSPSPLVFERILIAIQNNNLNWYPDVNNTVLTNKIASYVGVNSDDVLYFPSSDSIHEYIIRAFIEPNDNLLIVGPTYDNFRAVAETSGAIVNYFYLNNDFSLDIDEFNICLKNNVPKICYLVNPNNPTGSFVSIENVKKITRQHPHTLFLIDEAYFEFIGQSISNFAVRKKNLIVTRTFSKAFALASFRIGYVISNSLNIHILNKIRNSKNISTLSQVAAEAALDSIVYMESYVAEVSKSRDYFVAQLNTLSEIKIYPSCANFVFIKFYSSETKYEIIRFLENYKIFVRDYGHVNGMGKFIRISIGTMDQMKIVVTKLHTIFNLLKNETNNPRP